MSLQIRALINMLLENGVKSVVTPTPPLPFTLLSSFLKEIICTQRRVLKVKEGPTWFDEALFKGIIASSIASLHPRPQY